MTKKKTSSKRFPEPGKRVMMGNIAMAEGAMVAGLEFFAGYPITPSTEVPEYLVRRLPEVGGAFIQMEDELASINAVMGASLAGVKAMTATSGPGVALMAETISYAANLEIPFVLCDVQRNGPGTGFVTAPHHNDIKMIKHCGNGEFEIIAYAPMSCQELFDLTIEAFNASETYRCPVFMMSDAYLGHLHELVEIPPQKELAARLVPREFPSQGSALPKFSYIDDSDVVQVPPPPQAGSDHFPTFMFSQPHDTDGVPLEETKSQRFIETISRKITDNIDQISKIEEYMVNGAEILIIAYGLPARTAYRVVKQAREQGIKVGLLRLITVWPFPMEKVKVITSSMRAVLVPELNLGMIAEEVERATPRELPVIRIPKISEIHHPDDIMNVLEEVARS